MPEGEEKKRYIQEKVMDKVCYLPNKQAIFPNLDKISRGGDVNLCLMKFFEREYVDDLVKCDGCKGEKPKGVKADKEFFIYRPPKILTILLKRFKSHGSSLMKNSASIDTLERIYLDDYVIIDDATIAQLQEIYGPGIKEKIENATPDEESLHLFEYRLYAVSNHSGSIHGGHYIAHVKHGEQWYYASDSHTSREDLKRVLNAEAYLLFYERIW